MADLTIHKEFELTLRHTFGDLLDMPLLARRSHTPAQSDPSALLAEYSEKIRYCDACSFHIGRSQLVFGRGHWEAPVAFVGDFPSLEDDKNGEPFSGESGELLHKMILAMKLQPESVYFTNLFKCRPAAGDSPSQNHFEACEKHLSFQFSQVRAPLLIAMGEDSAKALARAEAPLRVLRKQIFEWQGRQVICTHHPRDLLKSPALKKEAWDDLQFAMRALGRLLPA